MARKKLTQTQIACIILLWIGLVTYIVLYSEITTTTIVTIIFSAVFTGIPIYRSLKK